MASAATTDGGQGLGIERVGDGWAHGFLPAVDLWGGHSQSVRERSARSRRDGDRSLHGPCANCGMRYYAASTACHVPCPNCGHRVGCGD